MDLRNLSATPNQMDSVMQRRPSLSSLSSTSGYASSTYGGTSNSNQNNQNNQNNISNHNNHIGSNSNANTSNNTPQMSHQRLSGSTSRNTLNLQNSWLNQNSGSNVAASANVGPWVEQQQQQQHSTLSSLDAKGKLDSSGLQSSDPSGSNIGKDDDNSVNNTINDTDTIDDDELIPTAIVIKNIPFAIKKEQLLDVMTKLNLPLPYAFNYHFDNGVFRGLAFANFTSTEETSLVVNHLNGREIGGRKLRVEYKKMLPLQERERIEREKREKRGQLEEQHRSTSNASLASLMSAASTTAATKNLSVSAATPSGTTERLYLQLPLNALLVSTPPMELNFNDSETLELYSQLLLFRDDIGKSVFELAISPANLNLTQRKILSILCNFLNLLEMFDNGLIIIRRKHGHVVQSLTQTALGSQPVQPSHSSSMMNLGQLASTGGNTAAAATTSNPAHPELLRSQSQSALPLPRLRQQTSTPIQQFSQYQQAPGQQPPQQQQQQQQQPVAPQQQGRGYPQQFNMYQQPQQQSQQQNNGNSNSNNPQVVTPTMVSSSAASLLRSSNNRSYVDIRSTPPLGGNFNQQQGQHSNQQNSITNSPTPQHHHNHHLGLQQQQQHFFQNQALGNPSQPTTPLASTDINSRFQPFGQHAHLNGSMTSLQHQNGSNVQLEDYSSGNNDPLNNKFNNLNLSGAPYEMSNSGIWGPK
ncbi:predicted protein [Scheffersomyces stipitis CBS 6054]|uniref:RRM domain-containing protein n=1 Tax=Scheffersomyces stipitis (strain ATCC 58785 / CBS 6054 / NBRC 10063 / NRRL Y-11545) TaxID=322104 RepID=A3M0I1_PICST|nr:predicted protein [Scheffersomyces stipitis CBS 6054]ABN68531.1 predicted protein [Scheffersomyces stipitis CBS 6054]